MAILKFRRSYLAPHAAVALRQSLQIRSILRRKNVFCVSSEGSLDNVKGFGAKKPWYFDIK